MSSGTRKIRLSSLIMPIALLAIVASIVVLLIIKSASQEPAAEIPGLTVLLPNDELSAVLWHNGFIWCGGREGLYKIHPQELTAEAIKAPDGIPKFQYVRGLLSYRDALWVAYDGGVARLDTEGWQASYENFPDIRMTSLCAAPDGTGVWAGSYSGAVMLDNNMHLQTIMLEENGLVSSMVNVVTADSKGNIWFGSYLERPGTGGVSVLYPDGHIQHLTDAHGLPHHDITSFLLLENGDMLAGCGMLSRGGAARLKLGKNEEYAVAEIWTVDDGLAGEKVRFLYAHENQIWFCSETNGIARYEDGEFIDILTKQNGLSDNEIKHIAVAPDGMLYLASRYGLTCITQEGLAGIGKFADKTASLRTD